MWIENIDSCTIDDDGLKMGRQRRMFRLEEQALRSDLGDTMYREQEAGWRDVVRRSLTEGRCQKRLPTSGFFRAPTRNFYYYTGKQLHYLNRIARIWY